MVILGSTTVNINVEDVNDVPPHFIKDVWELDLSETVDDNIPEGPILNVNVIDEDTSNTFHYEVKYSLVDACTDTLINSVG